MKTENCVGCGKDKPQTKMKQFNGELLCKWCRNQEALNKEFGTLENNTEQISDKIIDAQSDLLYWEEGLKVAKTKLEEAKNTQLFNELDILNFDWNRWVLDEPKEESNE
ncbi:hypothetical protein [Paenibacillus sp. FSL H3-0333]|uniref:hypothetical protein n=1 Tax=Paenibacillus sp. FSL H3-0333 TaxID=2921373 RepID=UPI0030FB071F